ncbi:putative extracellular serine-rich protein [Aspergillus clavatus NRRL 1]|uniref:Extracellular serine-rich protein, putative n=1 Tax=Aspergillus clavatus (strain ATCC 1007 / CBS 513.65 / DSM 816 / NCTC 3887 / NRRL 1 / QM 1276 / 107) TaxID=344612 RepID=A1CFZ6_ASPCL|nr:extracellular serine-rich protein, putative [Aspergillus clavatus NRRL 1]EAW10876.1 extracellular serine-rich protein, putative [Aspergillus clavatus NRRL 1]
MHFTKALLVTAAAFAPFAFAAEQAEGAPKTITVQMMSVGDSTPTPSSTLIPSATSTPIIATPSSHSVRPSYVPGPGRWNSTSSTIKMSVPATISAPAQTGAASQPSSLLVQTGAASSVHFSGALAAGVMAVAGLVAL